MRIGYARVSRPDDQDVATQIDALTNAGAERIYQEHASGGRWNRPELHRALDQLREDDVFMVWKLDRLSRSLKDLIDIIETIDQRGAAFQSLTDAVDTSGPAGRMLMHMIGTFAEYERSLIRQRTQAGLQRARQHGRIGGRPAKLTRDQQRDALAMIERGIRTQADVARSYRVGRSTITRLVNAYRRGEITIDP